MPRGRPGKCIEVDKCNHLGLRYKKAVKNGCSVINK